MSPIRTYKEKNGTKIIKVYQDEGDFSPRDWDNLGRMVCFHNRYALGDKTDLKSERFSNFGDLKSYLIEHEKAKVILPIYMYDHSGITVKTSPFGDCWDSGQIGYIYATEEDMKKECSNEKKAREILLSEVDAYDKYLRGDVYAVCLYESKKCKSCGHIENDVIEFCGGIYDVSEIFECVGMKKEDFEEK